jgi:hypothetical protein
MSSNNLPAVRSTPARPAIGDMIALAECIKSAEGLIPKACLNNTAKIVAYQLVAQDFGIGLMEAFVAFHIVEGKRVADYSFWIARLKGAGYRVEWSNCTAESATLTLTAPDGSRHVETWNKERAIRAGLWGNRTWKPYAETMLKARCVSSAGRAFAAEVMFGCYTEDEIEEIRTVEATVTTAPAEPPKRGVEGLAQKLTGAPIAVFAGADAIGDALAAIASAETLEQCHAVRERLQASKLNAEHGARAKDALIERVNALKAAAQQTADAATDSAEREATTAQ